MKTLMRLVAVVVCLLPWSVGAQSYTVTDLGAFIPFHITEEGVITGDVQGGDIGALWQDGTLHTFSTIARLVDANSVHAVGQTVHNGQLNAATITFDGIMTPLHTPDTVDGSFVNTISMLGNGTEIIGGYVRQGFQIFPARWFSNIPTIELLPSTPEGGAMNASNDLGQGAGYITVNGAEEVARWALDGSLTPLGTLGGHFAYATDMNNAGVLIGVGALASGPAVPFRSQGDSLTALPVPPGFASAHAFAVNAQGQVVGRAHPQGPISGDNDFRAYLWDVNGFPTDLNTLAPIPAGWALSTAFGINDAGEIVGYMATQSGSIERRGVLLTPDTPRGLPSLALSINQANFTPGQHLDTTLVLSNPGAQRQVDMYVGIVFPDGWVWWVKDVNTFEGTASDSLEADPSTFTSLWPNMTLIAGLNATWTDFIEHTWTGLEGAGTYHLVVGWTVPDSLQDGVIDEGDLLALDWKAFNVSGSPATVALAK